MDKNKMIGAALAVVIIAGAGFALLGGTDDEASTDTSQASAQTKKSDAFPLDFTVNNLAPLEQGAYEGWVVRGDDKYSFGTFNTTESGAIDGAFALSDITPQDGDKVVVTIEPTPDTNPEPSGVVVLAGDIVDGSTELAFPVGVSGFTGKYVLATPSDGEDNNETSGVWFLSLESGSPAVGLDLPAAPEGWAYEGWVVYNGAPVSTGQFTDPATADNFSGFSGPEMTPPFPGEDFVTNLPGDAAPYDLANGSTKVVISLEPSIDGVDPTGPNPAQVKPLVADVAEGAADHSTFDLSLDTSSLPTGSASL